MIHLWNAWSHGIGATEGQYENAREIYEPFWTDMDYQDLCKADSERNLDDRCICFTPKDSTVWDRFDKPSSYRFS